jgi:hypothetical protein
MTRKTWQVAGGPKSRTYADVFLRCCVALIGPGDAGEWNSARQDNEFEGRFEPVAYANLA